MAIQQNPFDQFDSPAPGAANAAGGGNPFDAFDEKSDLSAEPSAPVSRLPQNDPALVAQWSNAKSYRDRLKMIIPWLHENAARVLAEDTPAGTIPKAILENGGAAVGMLTNPSAPMMGGMNGAQQGNQAYQSAAMALGAQKNFNPEVNIQSAMVAPRLVSGAAGFALPSAGAIGGGLVGGMPGAMAGAAGGDVLAQNIAMDMGLQDKYKLGQTVGTAISAMPIPGASSLVGSSLPTPGSLSGIFSKQYATQVAKNPIVRDAVKFGAANVAGDVARSEIDDNRMPTLAETAAHFAGPTASFPLAAFTDTGHAMGETMAKKTLESVRDATLAAGRKEGFVVPPIYGKLVASSDANKVQTLLENSSNRGDLKWDASLKNAPIVTRLAAEEVGLDPKKPVTYAALDAKIQEQYKPYQKLASVSPEAAKSLDLYKSANETRNSLLRDYNHPNQSNRTGILPQIAYQDQLSQMAEADLQAEAMKAGAPNLVNDLNKARVNLAKLYAVKNATNDDTGKVSAAWLAEQSTIGRPLTGKLNTITRMYGAFPEFMQNFEKIPAPGVGSSNLVKSWAAGSSTLAGSHLMGLPPMISVPAAAAASTLPFKADLSRKFLFSKFYQNSRMGQPFYGGMSPDAGASFLRFAGQGALNQLQNANNSATNSP